MREFSTFDDFFPYYVSQHSKPATRWFHFAGTHLGALPNHPPLKDTTSNR